METMLIPIVKIRPKGQITIPSEILQAWHVQFDEQINVHLVNGVVMLTPVRKNKTPNEKTAKILLASSKEKDYKGFDNLDDLFRDLKN